MSKLTFKQTDAQDLDKAGFDKLFPRVTRDTVDAWLFSHRPHLATFTNGAHKGTYHRGQGPAASFSRQGYSWREVLMVFVVTQE